MACSSPTCWAWPSGRQSRGSADIQDPMAGTANVSGTEGRRSGHRCAHPPLCIISTHSELKRANQPPDVADVLVDDRLWP